VDKNDVKEVEGQKTYSIKGFDIEKRTWHYFGYTVPGSEDFIWLDNKRLLMGKGNDLYLRKANDQTWENAGSISISGYGDISRMAYSKDLKKLVVAMNRKE
jgi:hypothetical protein